jgi:lipopolysaccharide transport system ATP-binding protein
MSTSAFPYPAPHRTAPRAVGLPRVVSAGETSVVDRHALRLDNVGKCYRRYARQFDRLKQWVFGTSKRYYQEHWALRGVSFAVERGQTVGILGANGSGKSTLLQLVAGTLTPTEGMITLRGRVAALLELGSGFHPEFTGWENMRLQASILGLTHEEVDVRLPQIAAFSELGEALDQPLRTYSSGMVVRLGFSVAISVDPELLLIDEALAVGDLHFQQKCMTRIRQLREQGVTILLVTHDLGATKRLCDEVHVLDRGRLVRSGPSEPVCNWYFGRMTSEAVSASQSSVGDTHFRHGSGRAKIERWEWCDDTGQSTSRAWVGGTYSLRVHVRYRDHVEQPVLGFYLRDRLGTELVGTNTDTAGVTLEPGEPGAGQVVSFRFALRLRPGAYTLCVALADDPAVARVVDWIDQAQVIEVVDPIPGRVIHGLVAEDIVVSVE